MATTTTTLSEQEVRARIQRGRPLALGLGVLGLIVWASGLATNPKLALQGYHMAFFYWMGLSLAAWASRCSCTLCAGAGACR
jgi:drug/metabolite transporter (DMT)-like permease